MNKKFNVMGTMLFGMNEFKNIPINTLSNYINRNNH